MFVTGETYDISIIHGIVTLSLRPYDPAGMKRMSEWELTLSIDTPWDCGPFDTPFRPKNDQNQFSRNGYNA